MSINLTEYLDILNGNASSIELTQLIAEIKNKQLVAHKVSTLISSSELLKIHSKDDFAAFLVENVVQSIGLSNQLFLRMMNSTSENVARIFLKEWSVSKELEKVDHYSLRLVLSGSIKSRKFELTQDIIHHLIDIDSVGIAIDVLSNLSIDVLTSISPLWRPLRKEFVKKLCSTHSYLSALDVAENDLEAELEVIRSIGNLSLYPGKASKWAELMDHMATSIGEPISKERMEFKYKSAASAVVKKINGLRPEDIKNELRSDRSRLIAFKLGLEDAIHQIVENSSKKKALEVSLGI